MNREIASLNPLEIKGLVLAGGKGTRLRPLTDETSKQLLPVGGKPLVLYAIESLLEAGVKDILLLIDDRHASQFMRLLNDGSHLGIRSLAYIWQSREGKGLPSAIAQAEPFIRGEKLVVVCGDVIIEEGIVKPVSDFIGQGNGARLCATKLEDTAGYSPLVINGNLVARILPKDKSAHEPGLIDLGVYMYHPDVFQRIRGLESSVRGETEIWDLNAKYSSSGELYFTTISGWWSDVGSNMETYIRANEHYGRQIS